MSRNPKPEGSSEITVRVPIPAKEPKLYGRGAVDDVLLYLSRHRFESLTPVELANWMDHSEATVRRAVDVLEKNDLVEYESHGNRKPVSINRSRLSVPDDPFLQIPQEEYQEPVKVATDQLENALEELIGIVLYGSVARGEADRRSDIDLWAVVDADRAPNQRAANDVERELEEQKFGGERYDFHISVEGLESVPAFTDDISEIILSGIPVHRTESFEKLRNLLAHGGDDEY